METKAWYEDMQFWAGLVAGISGLYVVFQTKIAALPVIPAEAWGGLVTVIGVIVGMLRMKDKTKVPLGMKTRRRIK